MSESAAFLDRFLSLHPKLIDLSLDRIRRLLEALGNPHRRLPPVIHVAGTNGKGSTIAFMRAMLETAGLRVHVYTSPHLVRFHERIRLGEIGGGRFVDEDSLVDAFRRCEDVNADAQITVFEITTAAAFLLFAENPADVLLLEVGLGGTFDTTNVVVDPAATVVTPVSMDHSEFLGDTVEQIAGEKAGILKSGAPAIFAPQDEAPLGMLVARADAVGAPAIIGGQDFSVHEENGRLVYQDERGLLDLPLPRLAGRHQHINAGTAIAALRHARGLPDLPAACFEQGVRDAFWPARLQPLREGRLQALLPAGSELWLDGSHNADGGRVTAAAIAEMEEAKPRPLILVVGMKGTKDARAFLDAFEDLTRDIVTLPVVSERGVTRTAQDIATIADAVGFTSEAAVDIEDALRRIAARGAAPSRVLITGSLYLAGEVLAANGTPPT
ncbi:MAG: bifunctional folylpolyglutamate synthase/dihydrofolate synthase [Rhizobiales bacterium 65-9]|nr:bifunctional folylpolyglutamate synthase/dihydrofolate synthase [Hyphomicrobiales bacterium]OJY35056.1 MAG: bifunctional folylpolyglutamate synthase/dihydrofolate synthase [Rhizobiales bacterium 65-9]